MPFNTFPASLWVPFRGRCWEVPTPLRMTATSSPNQHALPHGSLRCPYYYKFSRINKSLESTPAPVARIVSVQTLPATQLLKQSARLMLKSAVYEGLVLLVMLVVGVNVPLSGGLAGLPFTVELTTLYVTRIAGMELREVSSNNPSSRTESVQFISITGSGESSWCMCGVPPITMI